MTLMTLDNGFVRSMMSSDQEIPRDGPVFLKFDYKNCKYKVKYNNALKIC